MRIYVNEIVVPSTINILFGFTLNDVCFFLFYLAGAARSSVRGYSSTSIKTATHFPVSTHLYTTLRPPTRLLFTTRWSSISAISKRLPITIVKKSTLLPVQSTVLPTTNHLVTKLLGPSTATIIPYTAQSSFHTGAASRGARVNNTNSFITPGLNMT